MRAQLPIRRERDLNTSQQFLRSLGVSGIAHAVAILGIILSGVWGHKPTVIVPGYKVDLVTMDKVQPHSLLETKAKKKPAPPPLKKKSVYKKKKKVAIAPKKKKDYSGAKKIVPKAKKKEVKAEPKKKEVAPPPPPEPVKEKAPEPVEEAAPEGGIVTDGVAFPYIWYLKIVERKVRDNWVTRGVDISGKRRDPVVRFSIARDGSVADVRMEQSSGSDALDDSAISAVMASQPFPPLPEEYPVGNLGVHFGFSYEQVE